MMSEGGECHIGLVCVAVELPVMPDWIYDRGFSDERLLQIWHDRAKTHADIKELEYLPAPSPWQVRYRSVNCAGNVYQIGRELTPLEQLGAAAE